MKVIRWGCMALAACVLAAGCKTVSLVAGADQVSLTGDAADVAGCTSLGKVEASSAMLTDPDAERQLQNQTVTLGGNTLLFSSPLRRSGTVYACGEAASSAARIPAATPAPAVPAAPAAASPAPAPPPASPAQIVQRQVEAYNRRDLDAFLGFYADDAKIFEYPDKVMMDGKDAMRERYRKLFDPAPQLRAEIVNRMAFDRFVIDQEKVTGLADGRTIEGVAVYEVRDGRIARVVFLLR